jgi:DNA-binding CsgD family transcriptional regulator
VTTLTQREREVVQLLHDGHTMVRVAALLRISEHTVRVHVNNVARRLPGDPPALRRVLRHASTLLATV